MQTVIHSKYSKAQTGETIKKILLEILFFDEEYFKVNYSAMQKN